MKTVPQSKIFLALMLALTSGFAVAQDAGLRISTADAMKAATTKVAPAYPDVARQLRLEGSVMIEAHITEDGAVESAKPLTGNPILANAAVSALKHWKFTPFIEGGKPVRAIAPISFSFKL